MQLLWVQLGYVGQFCYRYPYVSLCIAPLLRQKAVGGLESLVSLASPLELLRGQWLVRKQFLEVPSLGFQ